MTQAYIMAFYTRLEDPCHTNIVQCASCRHGTEHPYCSATAGAPAAAALLSSPCMLRSR